MNIDQSFARNDIISNLASQDFEELRPHLHEFALSGRKVLHVSGGPIAAVFFPQTGYVSLLAALEGRDAEVGMVGREGMVGLSAILGSDVAQVDAIVQAPGTALRLNTDILLRRFDDSPAFRSLLLRHVSAFNVQLTFTAACNGAHTLRKRLARWLLMAHDRTAADTFPMTHEFLSVMLGVRRAGVTIAARALQTSGCIEYSQGRVTITSRSGLESAACECYRIAKDQKRRILG